MHEPSPTSREPDLSSGGPDSHVEPSDGRARILVIEDNSLLASTICDVLVLEGYAAECVDTLPRVETLLDAESFDLILADVGIPGAPSSEREYFARLRASAPNAAIVAMTGDPKALKTAGPSLGFDELIPKPFEIDELLRCVSLVLDRHGRGIAAGE